MTIFIGILATRVYVPKNVAVHLSSVICLSVICNVSVPYSAG